MATTPVTAAEITAKLTGCLLGIAVGDALGLPREGLSRRRAAKIFGLPPLSHRLLLKHGMVSDDTEHAIMVAESLLTAHTDPGRFAVALSWRLRLWLIGLPAGMGLATARAILKLCLGWSPARSGVRSAGNGPAMRAPLLGAVFAFQQDSLEEFLAASTRITHTDPRAREGALLIALAAREGALHGPVYHAAPVLSAWRQLVEDRQLLSALEKIENHLSHQSSAEVFADDLGLHQSVSGFINHTVPVVLYAWLRYQDDYQQAVEAVISLGGDTDTTGAIVGGLLGATLGDAAIPAAWIAGIAEWPKSTQWMRRLAERLTISITTGEAIRPPGYCWPATIFRNLVFLLIVLYHGFRRILPPY